MNISDPSTDRLPLVLFEPRLTDAKTQGQRQTVEELRALMRYSLSRC